MLPLLNSIMERLPTNSPVDKILGGGLEPGTITNVYGPAGSGKTNIALSCAIECAKSKKVLYVDTEGSFSPERFRQMGGTPGSMHNIIMVEAHDWNEQIKQMQTLESLAKKNNAGLVVVDSMVALYRLELDEKNFMATNKQLTTQYSILSKIARTYGIPVLVTNQVYSDGSDNVELSSKAIAKYWSKILVELRRTGRENCRVAFLRKHRSQPEGRSVEFEIIESGFKEIGKFSIF